MEKINDTKGIQSISIDMIEPNPFNTRKKMNPDELTELSQSIAQVGLLQPITVRHKFATTDLVPVAEDYYEIVCGHRRFEAAKQAGMTEVPCIVRVLSDEEAFEIMVTENLQRKDIDPFDEADAFSRLKMRGYDIDTLADKFGKSKTYVFTRMRLLNLLPEFKSKYDAGELDMSHCLILSRLERDFQKKVLDKYYSGGYYDISGMTVKQLKQSIVGMGCYLANAVFDTSACENCMKNTGCASLFLDIDKAVCEDFDCYMRKSAEFAMDKFEQVRKRNPDFFVLEEKNSYLRDTDKLVYEELKKRNFTFKTGDSYNYSDIKGKNGHWDISDESIIGYAFGYKGFFGPLKKEDEKYKPTPRIDEWHLKNLAENKEAKIEEFGNESAFQKILNLSDDQLLHHPHGFGTLLEAVLTALISYTNNDDIKFMDLVGDMDADEAAEAVAKMQGQGILPAIAKYLVASGLLEGIDMRFMREVFPEQFKGSEEEGKKRYIEACRDCFYNYETPVTDAMIEEELKKILEKK